AGRAADPLDREEVVVGELEARDALERVAPPGAVVDGVRHGLAELAVARQRDAGLALPLDDIDDCLLHELLVLGGALQCEAVVLERARGVRLDQLLRAGQASGGRRLDRRHRFSSGVGWTDPTLPTPPGRRTSGVAV